MKNKTTKIYLNKLFANGDKTKQFRIVKHLGKYISNRVFKYNTEVGNNSAGDSKEYDNIDMAVKTELKWCYEGKYGI